MKNKFMVFTLICALLVGLRLPLDTQAVYASTAYSWSAWCIDNGYGVDFDAVGEPERVFDDSDLIIIAKSISTGDLFLYRFKDVIKVDYRAFCRQRERVVNGIYGTGFDFYFINESNDNVSSYSWSVFQLINGLWDYQAGGKSAITPVGKITSPPANAYVSLGCFGLSSEHQPVVDILYISNGVYTLEGGYIDATVKQVVDVGEAFAPIISFVGEFLSVTFLAFGYDVSVGAILAFAVLAGAVIGFIKRG